MEQGHFEALYPDTTRESDIESLKKFIMEGTSAQLLSVPGAGRSTILGLLANNRKVRIKHFGKDHLKIHFILVNFSEIKNRSLFDVTKFLFLSLADSLRERKMEEYKKINDLFRESLGFNDELVLFQALKEAIDYLTIEKKLKIIFLFDRFEEYVPSVTSEFFTNLRTLRNRAKYQFAVIFSVHRPLEDLLDPDQLFDFYELVAGHHVYMELFDKVTTDFRIGYIEKVTKRRLSKDLTQKIIKETGGTGRLIKLSVEALLYDQNLAHGPDLTESLFSQKVIKSALMEICRSLTPSEQNALIKQKYDEKSIVEYLEKVGVIKGGKIQIPLFDKHIKMHALERSGSTQKILLDGNTNSIKMGDTVLSDQLTSSEFRLLRFLLQNADQVIERDTIISVVWSDVKSTAGITDQAVDQLIFRLRRKIEEDPNQPTHLLTVKGRGFRFLP